MPRIARLVVPGLPHHLTHRGDNREAIFVNDDDRRTYLSLLRRYIKANQVTLLGYCLMPNHIHLIAVPHRKDSFANGVGRAHLRYAQIYNWRHGRVGHLWQGRYYSCVMDEDHLVTAMRYVERNPVRAGIVQLAWEYPWSSAIAHISGKDIFEILDLQAWSSIWSPAVWQKRLLETEDEKLLRLFRLRTSTGRPFGSKQFVCDLENRFDRRLQPRKKRQPLGDSNLFPTDSSDI